MIIYYYNDYQLPDDSNQTQYFFTGKTAADKARRKQVREYFTDKTERDWWLNEHPVKSFELKGKEQTVEFLNEAARNGFVLGKFCGKEI